jgi:hypothetical protein
MTGHELTTILADFKDWNGGFEVEETSICERREYAENAADERHTITELYEALGVPHLLGVPLEAN